MNEQIRSHVSNELDIEDAETLNDVEVGDRIKFKKLHAEEPRIVEDTGEVFEKRGDGVLVHTGIENAGSRKVIESDFIETIEGGEE